MRIRVKAKPFKYVKKNFPLQRNLTSQERLCPLLHLKVRDLGT